MRPDDLKIADPCHENWDTMEPREKARFCTACQLDVIDVSAMKRSEAVAFSKKPRYDRVCVSYIVRKDGAIRFSDTPANTPDVQVQSLFRRGRAVVAAAALSLAACQPAVDAVSAMGASIAHAEPRGEEVRLAGVAPIQQPPAVADAGVPVRPPVPRAPVQKPTTSEPATTTPADSASPPVADAPCPPRRSTRARPDETRHNGGLSITYQNPTLDPDGF